MGIVTKKGDRRKTPLLSGEEVDKDSKVVEAFGTVDELSSILGLARSTIDLMHDRGLSDLSLKIRELQTDLFRFASELACSDASKSELTEPTGEKHVRRLEDRIGALEEQIKLPSLFIIPGACQASAIIDIARAVSRRLERRVVALAKEGDYGNDQGLIYANRLSDYLFMLARAIEHFAGIPFYTKER
jgi:cob(I)alamin adenosyltransferase